MAEHRHEPETDGGPDYEGLLLRAGFNFQVFLAGAFGFARERGDRPEQFVDWVAARLTSTWAGLRGHGADAILRLVLDNLASTGYGVEETSFAADESQATVTAVPFGLPEEDWRQVLAPFAVSPADMRLLFRAFMPLAASAGATLDVDEAGESLRISVRRRTGAPTPADLA